MCLDFFSFFLFFPRSSASNIYTGDRPKALLNGQRWVPVNFTLGCVLYVEQTDVRDNMRLQSGGDRPNKKKKKKGIGNWWLVALTANIITR